MNSVKITYENSLEDLVAFNRYHFAHSPTARRSRSFLLWLSPLCILLFLVPLALAERSLGLMAIALISATLCALVAPWILRTSMERQVRKLYSEGANKGTIGKHELELTEDELIERTSYGEQRTRLQAFERVITTSGYTFIYVSALMAHVIPQNAVLDGDYNCFVERIKQRLAADKVTDQH